MLCLLEGAFVFSRAMRSTESLHVAGATAVQAVGQALREAGAEGLREDDPDGPGKAEPDEAAA